MAEAKQGCKVSDHYSAFGHAFPLAASWRHPDGTYRCRPCRVSEDPEVNFRRRDSVALSSGEAELAVVTKVAAEALGIQSMLSGYSKKSVFENSSFASFQENYICQATRILVRTPHAKRARRNMKRSTLDHAHFRRVPNSRAILPAIVASHL